MARIRTIKPEFWESEKVGRMSSVCRLTFVGLISLADDEGRGRGDPDYIWGRLHSYYGSLDDPRTLARLQRNLDVTSSVANLKLWWTSVLRTIKLSGLVQFYKVDGCAYYWIPGFCEHQKVDRPSRSRFPAPPSLAKPREDSPQDQGSGIRDQGREGRGEEGTPTPPVSAAPGTPPGGSAPPAPRPTAGDIVDLYRKADPTIPREKALPHVEAALRRGVSPELALEAVQGAPSKLWDILDGLGGKNGKHRGKPTKKPEAQKAPPVPREVIHAAQDEARRRARAKLGEVQPAEVQGWEREAEELASSQKIPVELVAKFTDSFVVRKVAEKFGIEGV